MQERQTTELGKVFKLCNMQPIAFNPAFKVLTGSVHGGILLSQIMYWYSRTQRKFFKTDQALRNELFFTERELKTAKQYIKNVPFIKITKEGVPCRTFYDIDWDIFQVSMKAISDQITFDDTAMPSLDETVPTSGNETVPTITEITTDIKKEIYKEKRNDAMLVIGSWFHRRPTTQWSDKELKVLNKLTKRADFDIELQEISKLYLSNYQYKRKDIQTLLNNWTVELDRARKRQPAFQNNTGWDAKTRMAIG